MQKIKELLLKNRELAAYAAAGLLTTAVNYAVYSALTVLCGLGVNLSNLLSWAAAVLVAFLTNKAFVFQSPGWSPKTLLREGSMFVGSRLLSGAVVVGLVPVLMALGVDQSIFGVPGFAAKLIAEIVDLVINYLCSKFVIFK